jgi:hypothetical protein
MTLETSSWKRSGAMGRLIMIARMYWASVLRIGQCQEAHWKFISYERCQSRSGICLCHPACQSGCWRIFMTATTDHTAWRIYWKKTFIMDLETIRELQTLVVDCSRGKRSQYDIWTNDDSIQKVKAYLRSLNQIVEGSNRRTANEYLQSISDLLTEWSSERFILWNHCNGNVVTIVVLTILW